jgi:ABC-type microcin C transport system permease subunit YejB
MIKQSFLDSLEGLSVVVAQAKVLAEGHEVYLVPEDAMAITLQARPNTVILWQEDGIVSSVQAGDGLELDIDV